MVKFKVDAIRWHKGGLQLELREYSGEHFDPKRPSSFRCSAPATGFTLNFDPSDPLYEQARTAVVGSVFELQLLAPAPEPAT